MVAKSNEHDTEHIDQALANIEERLENLVIPEATVHQLETALSYLQEIGVDNRAIEAFTDGANTLFEVAQDLTANLQAALNLARTLKQQREQALETLAELRRALDECDTSVPEIADLVQSIEESMDMDFYLMDIIWDTIYDRISEGTGLTWQEAVELTDFLTDGVAPYEHPIWQKLRAWLAESIATLEAEDERR